MTWGPNSHDSSQRHVESFESESEKEDDSDSEGVLEAVHSADGGLSGQSELHDFWGYPDESDESVDWCSDIFGE